MLNEAHYEAALNYFYFMFLDEGASLNCALKSIKLLQKQIKKNPNKSSEALLIECLSTVWNKSQKQNARVHFGHPPKSDWKSPNKDVLAAWKDYLKKEDFESAEVLVLRYILGYPVKIIAEALGIPEGTIYFRLGRGLEIFGAAP